MNRLTYNAVVILAVVERVVHVSMDGLGGAYVNATNTPNLMRLVNEGTSTLNARTDSDFTKTMPNHFSQLSGRGVLGEGGHGITFNQWDPVIDATTVHDIAGDYVSSVFDVVHDNGLRTAAYVSKGKLDMIDLSWSENGAPDTTGENNGTDKIDVWVEVATGRSWNGSSFVDAWTWNLADLNDGAWLLPNVDLSAGSYSVAIWAWDNEENRAARVDNPQPVITVG